MYDEILEKMNYWDDDQDVKVRVADKIEASTPRPLPKKINKKINKLPSLKPKYSQLKSKTYSNLSTPWNGIEEYFKQCERSEKLIH